MKAATCFGLEYINPSRGSDTDLAVDRNRIFNCVKKDLSMLTFLSSFSGVSYVTVPA
jgi:hypothetical protein